MGNLPANAASPCMYDKERTFKEVQCGEWYRNTVVPLIHDALSPNGVNMQQLNDINASIDRMCTDESDKSFLHDLYKCFIAFSEKQQNDRKRSRETGFNDIEREQRHAKIRRGAGWLIAARVATYVATNAPPGLVAFAGGSMSTLFIQFVCVHLMEHIQESMTLSELGTALSDTMRSGVYQAKTVGTFLVNIASTVIRRKADEFRQTLTNNNQAREFILLVDALLENHRNGLVDAIESGIVLDLSMEGHPAGRFPDQNMRPMAAIPPIDTTQSSTLSSWSSGSSDTGSID